MQNTLTLTMVLNRLEKQFCKAAVILI
jgi:hypothetical protein